MYLAYERACISTCKCRSSIVSHLHWRHKYCVATDRLWIRADCFTWIRRISGVRASERFGDQDIFVIYRHPYTTDQDRTQFWGLWDCDSKERLIQYRSSVRHPRVLKFLPYQSRIISKEMERYQHVLCNLNKTDWLTSPTITGADIARSENTSVWSPCFVRTCRAVSWR